MWSSFQVRFYIARLKHALMLRRTAGDHLYRMDYMDFVQKHVDTGVRTLSLSAGIAP